MMISDIQALKQALQQLGAKEYKVIRKIVRGFNNYGRPDVAEVEAKVYAVIQPSNKRIEIDVNGNGEWVTSEFSIIVVEPDFICSDDIFITKEYGELKIIALNDNRYQGSMSAEAIRRNATGKYLRSDKNI